MQTRRSCRFLVLVSAVLFPAMAACQPAAGPATQPGAQIVAQFAQSLQVSGLQSLLSRAPASSAPIGDLNGVNASGIAWGWSVSPELPSEATVIHFYVDQAPGPGSFAGFAGQASADLPRPDVNSATGFVGPHGFQFRVPERYRDGRAHRLLTYAIGPDGAGNPQIGVERSFQLAPSAVAGNLDGVVAGQGVVWGWAVDRARAATSITMHFYVDVPPALTDFSGYAGQVVASLPRPDVKEAVGYPGDHGFSFAIPDSYRDGKAHALYAYAITADGANPVLSAALAFRLAARHVRHYGYFASAYDADAQIATTSDHANVTWVRGLGSVGNDLGEQDALNKIIEAERCGMKVILAVEDVLFYRFMLVGGTVGAATEMWERYWSRLREHAATVVGIYPMDEPFWSSRNDPERPRALVKRELEKAIRIIKLSTKSAIPVIGIFAPDTVDATLASWLPNDLGDPMSRYDWLGFDCNVGGGWQDCSGRSVPDVFALLASARSGDQKLVLIPDANVAGAHPAPSAQADVAVRADQYLELASSHPSVVGVFPFTYQTIDDGGATYTGAADMPPVLSAYRRFGQAVTGARPGCPR